MSPERRTINIYDQIISANEEKAGELILLVHWFRDLNLFYYLYFYTKLTNKNKKLNYLN